MQGAFETLRTTAWLSYFNVANSTLNPDVSQESTKNLVIFFYRDTEFVSNNMIYLIGISYFFGIPVFCALLMGFAKEPKELPTERNESEEESKSDK